MKYGKKVKVCISLSPDVVERIDERAKAASASRSAIVEELLREGELRMREHELVSGVEAYYAGRSPAERSEDDALGRTARTLDLAED
jgi:predicted transcriptional regulator